jgi:hypothetical protein
MSKRTQLWIALGALGVVILLLIILFVAVMGGDSATGGTLPQVTRPAVWDPGPQAPVDPTAGREERARSMVWDRLAESMRNGSQRLTIRQAVETDLLRRSFPNLHWDRIERVGWRAFQQEGTVYEVQFVLQDGAVEFGPSWLVQTDPAGLQPPGSGGVVPANVFAELVQRGPTEYLERFLGREAEVVEALTNHRFEKGARLVSALLIYFRTRRNLAAEDLLGWTVVGERIREGEPTLYRAFFQWRENERTVFAHWEVNLDTRQFRGLNLLASEIMAAGDQVDAQELESIRPRMLDGQEPTRAQRRLFDALRAVVDNERRLEAVTALLWHRARHGTQIEYSSWNARRLQRSESLFEVSYNYLENGEERQILWHVDLESGGVVPHSDVAHMVQAALWYEAPAAAGEPGEPEAPAPEATN